MDAEDESTAYMKLFNEGTHNYLLHSSEDGLNDAFSVEPIFTEIGSEWSPEAFPILLSGPLITDENNDSESVSPKVELLSERNGNSTQSDQFSPDNTVRFLSNVEKNSLILSNDVLFKVEKSDENNSRKNTVTHVINGDTYSITYTQDSQDEINIINETDENVEVIELLDVDGTITTIDKNLLNIMHGKDKRNNFDSFYTKVQANKCKLCSFLCEDVDDMVTHIRIKHETEVQHNGNITDAQVSNGNLVATKMTSILNTNQIKKEYTLYLCSACGSGYSDKEDLKKHMISQHQAVEMRSPDETVSDKPPSAKPKRREFEQKHSLRAMYSSLLKKQKVMRKVKCSFPGCVLRFDKEESCKKHEECHVDQNKKQFVCPVCEVKFSIWRICSMHMWKSHSIDVGLLTCPMCNEFKSYSGDRVINHMAIHNEQKPFVCASCGKRFKQLNQLRNHEVIHKSQDELPTSASKKQCEFCDRVFANPRSLKKHIKYVHDKLKPFICNICGHQTARKDMLELHHRQHTGDKPFHCTYCEYKTGDGNSLRRHMWRHLGYAKYSCPYCNYQSIQTSAYKTHLTNKHPGKEGTYACTICRYTTINLPSYLSHVKCHELEKPNKTNGKLEKTDVEDSESKSSDETHNFLNTEHSEEAVDTGGITIPAEFDLQLTNGETSLL